LASTELFDFDSAKLKMPEGKLDEIATALNNHKDVSNVTITGYADNIGAAKYNQKLSERRANAVKDYLVSKGVDPSRLTAVGKGEADPVVDCKKGKRASMIKCLEPNRRVVVEEFSVMRHAQ
jgi:OOP family OmpA-OmpF porin